MKTFYRKTIASCLSMIVLFLTIGPAAAADVTSAIEIRGPVYNGSDIDEIIDTYGDGTTLTVDATQFAAFYYNIDDDITNETLRGTFNFNVTDVGKGTGEGTYNITTGTIKFNGTSIAQGNFTGTYNINTKEGTITYNTDLLGAISNFTATYDKITNNLDISIADSDQLRYYPYVETDLGEVSNENITVTEEIEGNIAQEEPYDTVYVNATK